MEREGTEKPKPRSTRVSVKRDRYTCMGRDDCSDHRERPLAVGTSETSPLGYDLCGSGAWRLLVQVST